MSDQLPLAALDTNLLVYAEGIAPLPRDAHKPKVARELIAALPTERVVIPVQVLGELFRVLTGKGGRSRAEARAAIVSWRDAYGAPATTEATMLGAADLAAAHGLSIWDAVILTAAADAGCRLVLSEDMQDGFSWRGMTVTNPFGEQHHHLLKAMLRNQPRPS
ncbi:MAG: PIN domain-containing protein [Geminicoccaceae bacterium]